MAMQRFQVYADEDTKRRVEVAALKCRTSVTEYCLEAIRQRLAEDGLLEPDRVDIVLSRTEDHDVMLDLRRLRAAILDDRDGRPIDIDEVLQNMREERVDAVASLR